MRRGYYRLWASPFSSNLSMRLRYSVLFLIFFYFVIEIPLFCFEHGISFFLFIYLFFLLFVGQLQSVHGDGVCSRRRDVLTPKTNWKVQVSVILSPTHKTYIDYLWRLTHFFPSSARLQWTTCTVLCRPNSADIWVPPFTRPHIQRSETWEPSHWPPWLHSGELQHQKINT